MQKHISVSGDETEITDARWPEDAANDGVAEGDIRYSGGANGSMCRADLEPQTEAPALPPGIANSCSGGGGGGITSMPDGGVMDWKVTDVAILGEFDSKPGGITKTGGLTPRPASRCGACNKSSLGPQELGSFVVCCCELCSIRCCKFLSNLA